MYQIFKMRANHVIDHAAEELKKYLRMMMPEEGEVAITFDPNAKEGFRLGLLEDFGLPNEAPDVALDDVIHVDTDEKGGILAGSNPRSVLFAVYRYLRENGCRWLYPGIDGDYVPVKLVGPVQYHKMADHRFRGFCNEGCESQQCMVECADYYAKLEMNVYMMEWFIPRGYYNRYYDHKFNEKYRPAESVSDQQIRQWKVAIEAEISKRGLMVHDIGHGWTTKPFGFPGNNGKIPQEILDAITPEQKQVLALVKGKREFYDGTKPIFTNVCMSRADVRSAMAREVADYAEKSGHVDYIHVWLADGTRNHCECEECLKKTPSDWYMMIMNEIDEELTRRNLDTRIVFIVYVDTFWPPKEITIKNPERFSLLYAPIFRSYTSSITEGVETPPIKPFRHNDWETPRSPEEGFAHLKAWQEIWPGPCFSYEYHFWRHQYLDVGGLAIARRIYEDIRGLKYMKLDGFVEDGSQRSGFPNGFAVYIFAETLMNRDADYDAVLEDYFSHVYGEDWKKVHAFFTRVEEVFDFAYMEGERSLDPTRSNYYNPEIAPVFAGADELAAEARSLAAAHPIMPTRPQTVSYQLLGYYAEYLERWAALMTQKALGHDLRALELIEEFRQEYGRHEIYIERYYDHGLLGHILNHIKKHNPKGIVW